MSFSEELINYMQLLDCSAQDICSESGLSPTLISRYINNKRCPRANSEYVEKISEALYQISIKKEISIEKNNIIRKLNYTMDSSNRYYNSIADSLNTLLSALKISTSDLSKAIGYDPSFISRIRNKERHPSDAHGFIKSLGTYVVSTCTTDDKREKVSILFNCNVEELNSSDKFEKIFFDWIQHNRII